MRPIPIFKERTLGFEKSAYCNLLLRKIPIRQGTSGSSRHHFCLLKARRSDNSDDVLWFGQEKVGIDHKMLWFKIDFEAKNELENDVF
jgi:hypothetical protein